MRSALLLLLVSLTSTAALCGEPVESLSFGIYRVTAGDRTLIAEGTRAYTSNDIAIVPWGRPIEGYQERRKALELKDGFSIGHVVTRKHEADGFGLWIQRLRLQQEKLHPEEFSWEWFSHEEDDVFRKWPGEERVRVTHTQIPKGHEIRSVEFLTDVTLQFTNDLSLPVGVPTHEVVIHGGSVFRIAP